jgi:hypothetical protein
MPSKTYFEAQARQMILFLGGAQTFLTIFVHVGQYCTEELCLASRRCGIFPIIRKSHRNDESLEFDSKASQIALATNYSREENF